jgi:hypothetical protein
MALGSKLREARLRMKLTPADVAAATRMKAQIVDIIEREDFAKMPAPIYAKGFIRLFAECVKLDPAPLVAEYLDTFGHGKPATLQTPGSRTTPTQEKPVAIEPPPVKPEPPPAEELPTEDLPLELPDEPPPALAVLPADDLFARLEPPAPAPAPVAPPPELTAGEDAGPPSSETSLSDTQGLASPPVHEASPPAAPREQPARTAGRRPSPQAAAREAGKKIAAVTARARAAAATVTATAWQKARTAALEKAARARETAPRIREGLRGIRFTDAPLKTVGIVIGIAIILLFMLSALSRYLIKPDTKTAGGGSDLKLAVEPPDLYLE